MYTRLDGDTLGTLTQGEASLVAGGGSQTAGDRWGDYSALSIDPTDDCTFWFTGEYYATTSSGGWSTRVGSFNFGCDPPPVVTIESPTDGSTFNKDTLISFEATATDVPDGDLSAALSWMSDLDGALGTGGSLLAMLTVGTHTITASVTDSGSNPGLDSVQVEITESGCSDHVVLANGSVAGAEVHKALFSITAGPAFVVPIGASLTLRAGEALIFGNGFTVGTGGELSSSIVGAPCS